MKSYQIVNLERELESYLKKADMARELRDSADKSYVYAEYDRQLEKFLRIADKIKQDLDEAYRA
jgi:hypothetical protein